MRRDEGALGGATAFASSEAKPDERLEGLLLDCRLEIWGRGGPATVVFLGVSDSGVGRSGYALSRRKIFGLPSFLLLATLLSGCFPTDF